SSFAGQTVRLRFAEVDNQSYFHASVDAVCLSASLPCPPTFTVNSNGDASDATPGNGVCATAGGVCTLRAAIEEANALSSCGTININFSASTGSLILTNSTVSGNAAGDTGGGINNNCGTVVLTNSTVSGNTSGNQGGGIVNAGMLTLTNSTVAANTSGPTGGAIYNFGGATANIKNTIVANNTVNSGAGPDLGGTFNSQDYNLIRNMSGAT